MKITNTTIYHLDEGDRVSFVEYEDKSTGIFGGTFSVRMSPEKARALARDILQDTTPAEGEEDVL